MDRSPPAGIAGSGKPNGVGLRSLRDQGAVNGHKSEVHGGTRPRQRHLGRILRIRTELNGGAGLNGQGLAIGNDDLSPDIVSISGCPCAADVSSRNEYLRTYLDILHCGFGVNLVFAIRNFQGNGKGLHIRTVVMIDVNRVLDRRAVAVAEVPFPGEGRKIGDRLVGKLHL